MSNVDDILFAPLRSADADLLYYCMPNSYYRFKWLFLSEKAKAWGMKWLGVSEGCSSDHRPEEYPEGFMGEDKLKELRALVCAEKP